MINVRSYIASIKCSWLKQIFKDDAAIWKEIYLKEIGAHGEILLFAGNCAKDDLIKKYATDF